jgi:hypothetical protein
MFPLMHATLAPLIDTNDLKIKGRFSKKTHHVWRGRYQRERVIIKATLNDSNPPACPLPSALIAADRNYYKGSFLLQNGEHTFTYHVYAYRGSNLSTWRQRLEEKYPDAETTPHPEILFSLLRVILGSLEKLQILETAGLCHGNLNLSNVVVQEKPDGQCIVSLTSCESISAVGAALQTYTLFYLSVTPTDHESSRALPKTHFRDRYALAVMIYGLSFYTQASRLEAHLQAAYERKRSKRLEFFNTVKSNVLQELNPAHHYTPFMQCAQALARDSTCSVPLVAHSHTLLQAFKFWLNTYHAAHPSLLTHCLANPRVLTKPLAPLPPTRTETAVSAGAEAAIPTKRRRPDSPDSAPASPRTQALVNHLTHRVTGVQPPTYGTNPPNSFQFRNAAPPPKSKRCCCAVM